MAATAKWPQPTPRGGYAYPSISIHLAPLLYTLETSSFPSTYGELSYLYPQGCRLRATRRASPLPRFPPKTSGNLPFPTTVMLYACLTLPIHPTVRLQVLAPRSIDLFLSVPGPVFASQTKYIPYCYFLLLLMLLGILIPLPSPGSTSYADRIGHPLETARVVLSRGPKKIYPIARLGFSTFASKVLYSPPKN